MSECARHNVTPLDDRKRAGIEKLEQPDVFDRLSAVKPVRVEMEERCRLTVGKNNRVVPHDRERRARDGIPHTQCFPEALAERGLTGSEIPDQKHNVGWAEKRCQAPGHGAGLGQRRTPKGHPVNRHSSIFARFVVNAGLSRRVLEKRDRGLTRRTFPIVYPLDTMETLTRKLPDEAGTVADWSVRRDQRVARYGLMATYVFATLWYLRHTGAIPSDREIISGWFVGLALLATVGRTRREAVVVLLSWLPFLVAISLYDFARALGHLLDRPVEVNSQIAVDRFLGGGKLWTERLQGWLIDPKVGLGQRPIKEVEQILRRDQSTIRWYDVLVSVVYQSHFLVPYLTAGYLWSRGQRLWRWYAATFVAVNFAACAIFTLWATAPPWYAARQGLIEPFPRVLAGRGWSRVGLSFAGRLIEKGQGIVNPFAAIPSLHSAQALIVSIFLWKCVWKWLRPLLVAFPLMMGFALVYSGEHYVIDILTGWGLVALILTAGWYLRQRYNWSSPWRDGFAFTTSAPSVEPTRASTIDREVPEHV